ncbi:hypothetical protein WR25_01800 [Diploscapter pachys]|uniref:Histone deacetylase domain-containing protein n=1 Tax=Diploscapter pachys TaxID=2018661 RepID=A0A2A2LTR3_9BILA|nr:hypothetical protein WR25_01800 [Diploscapter pachys]
MVLFITDDSMMEHRCLWDPDHIEIPERMSVINQKLKETGLDEKLTHLQPHVATMDDIATVHDRKYVELMATTKDIKSEEELEKFCTEHEDVYVNQKTFDCALMAAGCAMKLAEECFTQRESGFALIRPPGHHASPSAACGFCIFNNVVIAAKHVRSLGAKRVLIVDWDIHAGNGTQECVHVEDGIKLISIHRFEHGFYWPHLQQGGVVNKFKNSVNVPLNAIGLTDSDYLAIFELIVQPVIDDYMPDFLFVSCGFDAAFGDPQGEMCVTPGGYANMMRMLQNTGLPVALIYEGGYFLESDAAAGEWVIRMLLGEQPPAIKREKLNPTLPPVIRRIYSTFGEVYPTMKTLAEIVDSLNGPAKEDTEPEYRGSRDVVVYPYITRGLYPRRPDEFENGLRKQLEAVIDSYKNGEQYPKFDVKLSADLNIAVKKSEEDANLYEVTTCHKMYDMVRYLVLLPLNPVHPPIPFAAYPGRTPVPELVEALRKLKEIPEFNDLPVFQLAQAKIFTTASKNERLLKAEKHENATEKLPFAECKLPNFDPWDRELVKVISVNFDPLKDCNKNFRKLTSLRGQVVESLDDSHDCQARCLLRESDFSNLETKFISFNSSTKFHCDIVQTRCYNEEGTEDYGMLHTQIVENTKNHTKKAAEGLQPDVYVILLDSLAHTQAIRNLPQTLSYFIESMGAIRFPYLNKVGKNSRPNALPLWFGKTSEIVERTAYEMPNIQPDWTEKEYCNDFLDKKGFLMKEYQEYGYRTLLAEDWADGAMNWPDCYGFDEQPTDHYMRPFQVEWESQQHVMLSLTYAKKNCIEQHQDIMAYLDQFVNAYEGAPKFGWVWMSLLTHNWQREVVHADQYYRDFLLDNRQKLDDAFVILMGDHGLRFGEATSTVIGEEEINHPLFAISLPKKLRNSPIAEQMRENAKQLQTHFDVRATFLDILKYQPAKNFTDTSLLEIPGEKFGSSLFRKQTPTERNCRTLPISFTYCICQFDTVQMDLESEKAIKLGKFVLDEINGMMKAKNLLHMCHPMEFDNLEQLKMYPPEELNGAYSIIVKAKAPSYAVYKVVVKRYPNDTYDLAKSSIDRLDVYGKQGNCVPYIVTHLCHCKLEYLYPSTTLLPSITPPIDVCQCSLHLTGEKGSCQVELANLSGRKTMNGTSDKQDAHFGGSLERYSFETETS